MDWADDITYATHDIEDFGANGRIPLGLLKHDKDDRPVSNSEVKAFKNYAEAKLRGRVDHFDESFDKFIELSRLFPERIVTGSRANATLLGRLTSTIITDATDTTRVDSDGMLVRDPTWSGTIEILKELTWFYVIHSPELVRVQRGQRKRLKAVVTELMSWVDEIYTDPEPTKDEKEIALRQLPELLRELVMEYTKNKSSDGPYPGQTKSNTGRAVIDFVASMTEEEVEQYYRDMCQ